jgi:Cu(I)/Ag(I) efflux system membrane fusion protein
MDLVPVFKEIIASHAPTHPFTLSPDQEQLLGLVSVPLTQREAIRTLRAPGRVEAGNGIIASFFEEDAFLLAPGQASEITFETLPGVTLPGKISSLVAVANPISHRMETRIDLDQTDRRLRLGFIVTVQVFIPLGRRLIAPLGAVLPTGERHVVLVDLGEGKIEPRYVKTGMALADGWEIISGAKEGERLLTSANFLVDAQARIAGALQGWGETP